MLVIMVSDAEKLGLLDKEEYVVSALLQHRGNLNRLKTVEVLVSGRTVSDAQR